MIPKDDSCIALVEALVEDAIVRQEERHAREDCIKAMAKAMLKVEPWTRITARTAPNYAQAALDAAIASGYVVINRP